MSISLSRSFLSESTSGSPGSPPAGKAAFRLFPVKFELLEGTSAAGAPTGCGWRAECVAIGCAWCDGAED